MSPCVHSPLAPPAFAMPGLPEPPVLGDHAMSPCVHSPLAPPFFAMPGLPEPPVLGDHAMSPSVHSPLAPFAFAMPGLPEPPVLGDHAMSPCVHSPLAPPAFAMPVLPEPPVLGDHAMSPFVHSPFGLAYQSQPVVGDHSMAASANPLAESSAVSPEPLPAGFPQLPSPDSDFGPFPVELFAKGALPKQEAQQPTMFCDSVHPSQSVHHQDLEVHRFLQDSQIMLPEAVPIQPAVVPQDSGQLLLASADRGGQVVVSQKAIAPQVGRHIVKPSEDHELQCKLALAKLNDDLVLAASVIEPDDQSHTEVEWEWGRVVTAIGVKTEKDHIFFKQNRENHIQELINASIPQGELKVNGNGALAYTTHCMNSRAFMLLILLLACTKQLAAAFKEKALSICIGLMQLGVKTLANDETLLGTVYVKGKGYISQALRVDSNGLVHGLPTLIEAHPGVKWAWAFLMKDGMCSQKITSSPALPTVWDLLILLVWAKTNPSMRNVWKHVGQLLWPQVLWLCGRILDSLALEKSKRPLEQLPLLKTAKGKNKRVPWQNKVILLRKLRRTKHHRKNTMESHSDVVPKGTELVTAEQKLTTALYAYKIRQAYQDAYHLSIHWDPSNYDTETMVSIIFSQAGGPDPGGLASYLPIQNMRPVCKKEVDDEILQAKIS